MKYFTLREAEALIPELERIFQNIQDIAERASAKADTVRALEALERGHAAELAIEKSQLQFLANGINEWFRKISDLGALPKGLDPALVDFPHRLGGREIYLCWKLGERSITHYHGIEEGFAGRKPIPARPPS